MANSNKQARKIETTKVTLSIIAVLLILATITVGIIGYFSQGFKNWDTENWGSKPGNAASIVDGEGNDLSDPDKIYPMPSNIIFTAAASPAGIATTTIEAVIQPETASNKSVDWSIAFANSASSWASGKNVTDFVTITPNSDGSTIAEISCSAAFAEQIIITCISRQNPDAKASATLDFYKRIKSFTITTIYDGTSYGDDSDIRWVFFDGNSALNLKLPPLKSTGNYGETSYVTGFLRGTQNVNAIWDTGTIIPNFNSYIVDIKYDTAFYNALTDAGFICYTDWERTINGAPLDVNMSTASLTRIRVPHESDPNLDVLIGIDSATYHNSIINVLRKTNGKIGTIKISLNYGNNFIKTQECEYGIDANSLGLIAQSIDLSDSNLFI